MKKNKNSKKEKFVLNLFPLDPSQEPKALPQPDESKTTYYIFLGEESKHEEPELQPISYVTCSHRPSYDQLKTAKQVYGVSLVVTCLGPTENPSEIKKFCDSLGLENFHIEVNFANKAMLGTE